MVSLCLWSLDQTSFWVENKRLSCKVVRIKSEDNFSVQYISCVINKEHVFVYIDNRRNVFIKKF